MNLSISRQPNGIRNNIYSQEFYYNRIGFWGYVESVDSASYTAQVKSCSGMLYPVGIACKEWINDEGKYVTAERDLPSVGSRVFVLCPSDNLADAFILCSGYGKGDTKSHSLYAQNENEVKEKNTMYERVSQGGWNETEDYQNGNRQYISQDQNIKITINPQKKDDNNIQEVAIIAWENEIHITKDGISISSKKASNITLNGATTINAKENITVNADKEVNISTSKFTVNNGNLEVT